MPVSYKNVILRSDTETAIITLNRPDCRNALSLDLILELLDCLGRIEQNRSVRPRRCQGPRIRSSDSALRQWASCSVIIAVSASTSRITFLYESWRDKLTYSKWRHCFSRYVGKMYSAHDAPPSFSEFLFLLEKKPAG